VRKLFLVLVLLSIFATSSSATTVTLNVDPMDTDGVQMQIGPNIVERPYWIDPTPSAQGFLFFAHSSDTGVSLKYGQDDVPSILILHSDTDFMADMSSGETLSVRSNIDFTTTHFSIEQFFYIALGKSDSSKDSNPVTNDGDSSKPMSDTGVFISVFSNGSQVPRLSLWEQTPEGRNVIQDVPATGIDDYPFANLNNVRATVERVNDTQWYVIATIQSDTGAEDTAVGIATSVPLYNTYSGIGGFRNNTSVPAVWDNINIFYEQGVTPDPDIIPVATIDAPTGDTTILLNETINFQGSATDFAGIDTYLWDFGDGDTAQEQNPSHQYTTAETVIVQFTATDNNDSVSLPDTIQIVIETPVAIVVAITAPSNNDTFPIGNQVNITGATTKGTQTISLTTLDVENGILHTDNSSTSTIVDTTHLYSTAGPFVITMFSVDSKGDTSNIDTITITIVDTTPVVPPAFKEDTGVLGSIRTVVSPIRMMRRRGGF